MLRALQYTRLDRVMLLTRQNLRASATLPLSCTVCVDPHITEKAYALHIKYLRKLNLRGRDGDLIRKHEQTYVYSRSRSLFTQWGTTCVLVSIYHALVLTCEHCYSSCLYSSTLDVLYMHSTSMACVRNKKIANFVRVSCENSSVIVNLAVSCTICILNKGFQAKSILLI